MAVIVTDKRTVFYLFVDGLVDARVAAARRRTGLGVRIQVDFILNE